MNALLGKMGEIRERTLPDFNEPDASDTSHRK
jgi:hypothetical protein